MKKLTIILCIALVTVLSACGYEDSYNDSISGSYSTPSTSGTSDSSFRDALYEYREYVSQRTPVSMPASGTILSGKEYYDSEITVTADSSSSYVVSLRTVSGASLLSFFVRSGDTVTVGVPSQELYVYFASGTTWYGYGEGLMFGENTVYSKDDEILDFSQYTWEYTLYPVYDGNFTETPSNENEFFG